MASWAWYVQRKTRGTMALGQAACHRSNSGACPPRHRHIKVVHQLVKARAQRVIVLNAFEMDGAVLAVGRQHLHRRPTHSRPYSRRRWRTWCLPLPAEVGVLAGRQVVIGNHLALRINVGASQCRAVELPAIFLGVRVPLPEGLGTVQLRQRERLGNAEPEGRITRCMGTIAAVLRVEQCACHSGDSGRTRSHPEARYSPARASARTMPSGQRQRVCHSCWLVSE